MLAVAHTWDALDNVRELLSRSPSLSFFFFLFTLPVHTFMSCTRMPLKVMTYPYPLCLHSPAASRYMFKLCAGAALHEGCKYLFYDKLTVFQGLSWSQTQCQNIFFLWFSGRITVHITYQSNKTRNCVSLLVRDFKFHINNTSLGLRSRPSSTAVQYSWETLAWTRAAHEDLPAVRQSHLISNTFASLRCSSFQCI